MGLFGRISYIPKFKNILNSFITFDNQYLCEHHLEYKGKLVQLEKHNNVLSEKHSFKMEDISDLSLLQYCLNIVYDYNFICHESNINLLSLIRFCVIFDNDEAFRKSVYASDGRMVILDNKGFKSIRSFSFDYFRTYDRLISIIQVKIGFDTGGFSALTWRFEKNNCASILMGDMTGKSFKFVAVQEVYNFLHVSLPCIKKEVA